MPSAQKSPPPREFNRILFHVVITECLSDRFALKIDEVSDIVETESGIHIIMRVELKKK